MICKDGELQFFFIYDNNIFYQLCLKKLLAIILYHKGQKKHAYYTIDIPGIFMHIIKIDLNIYLFKVFKPTQLNRKSPVSIFIYSIKYTNLQN